MGADRYSLPIVSVVSDAANFFDPEMGIYVPGNGYYDVDSETSNYAQNGRSWERPVHIELFADIGILGDPYPWQGIYFQDVPVKIAASPRAGYRFVGWEGLNDEQLANEASVEIYLTGDLKLTAHFETDED